jgi:hypothetical protein
MEPSPVQSAAKPNRDISCLPSILRELLYWRTGSYATVELIVALMVELIVGMAVKDGTGDDDVWLFEGTKESGIIDGAGDTDDALCRKVGDGESERKEKLDEAFTIKVGGMVEGATETLLVEVGNEELLEVTLVGSIEYEDILLIDLDGEPVRETAKLLIAKVGNVVDEE